jgi:hypothetical protein
LLEVVPCMPRQSKEDVRNRGERICIYCATVTRGKKSEIFLKKSGQAAAGYLYTGCERRGAEQVDKKFVKQLFLRMKESAKKRTSIGRAPQLMTC